jgi:hypothetical protein
MCASPRLWWAELLIGMTVVGVLVLCARGCSF